VLYCVFGKRYRDVLTTQRNLRRMAKFSNFNLGMIYLSGEADEALSNDNRKENLLGMDEVLFMSDFFKRGTLSKEGKTPSHLLNANKSSKEKYQKRLLAQNSSIVEGLSKQDVHFNFKNSREGSPSLIISDLINLNQSLKGNKQKHHIILNGSELVLTCKENYLSTDTDKVDDLRDSEIPLNNCKSSSGQSPTIKLFAENKDKRPVKVKIAVIHLDVLEEVSSNSSCDTGEEFNYI